MQKKFTITGVGICYGQVCGLEELAEALITNTPLEGCAPADAFSTAIREAVQNYEVKGFPVISNLSLDSKLLDSFGLQEVTTCETLEEMLEAAKDNALLVAGDEKGCFAVLLTQDNTGFASLSVQGKGGEKAAVVEQVLTMITIALEIRYALCLREAPSPMYRFWDSDKERQTAVSFGSLELTFAEPKELCRKVYKTDKYIFPVVFSTIEEAESKLRKVKRMAARGLYSTMQSCFASLSERTKETNTIVLMAETKEMLSEEIDNLLAKSKRLLDDGFVWRTRNGSIYIRRTCADPKVAFMNPPGGMFNAKVFYSLFLKLYGAMGEAARFVTDKFYTGSGEDFLSRTMFDMVVHYMVTSLLDSIGIRPDILSGICQGEMSIMFPYMKSKREEIQNMRKYTGSHLKKTVQLSICGDKSLLEAYLGRKVDRFAKYYLKHDLTQVREAVKKHDSVFIWEVGSVKDVMIEGEAVACQEVIEELGCMATELSEPMYIHTPIMEECRKEIRDCILNGSLYMDVDQLPFRIFSTYYGRYMDSTSEMLADNLSHLVVDEADFSGVPKALYEDEARVFIDLSPMQLCTTWARTALQNQRDAQVVSIYGGKAFGKDLCNVCASMLASNAPFEQEKLLARLSFSDDTVKEAENPASASVAITAENATAEPALVEIAAENAKAEPVSVAIAAENATAEPASVAIVAENAKEEPVSVKITAENVKAEPASVKITAENVKTEAAPVESEMQNVAEWQQYIRRQMAINEEAFRLYTNAQNALYEQMLSTMAASAPVAPKTEGTVEVKTKETLEISSKATTQSKANVEPKSEAKTEKPCLWNREQVITMTDSSMAAVLGDAYKAVDQYPVRARMPLPPFLFVSRITEIDAEFGVLRPGRIVAEYDFDKDCVFRIGDTHISSCVAAEASHIGIFLMGYMGLDAMSNGTLSFRALDCNQVYVEDKPFCVGDTMRTVFTIHRFAQNGPTTILYYDYETWNGDTLISRSEASGGFFTQAELASNKGVISPRVSMKKLQPKTLLHYGTTDKVTYTEEQVAEFYHGNPVACFGEQPNFSETYYLQQNYDMQMLERVTDIDYNGGKYGRGFISGEKTITPDLWPFDVHFKNDPVFPGIIMIDGVTQIEIFLVAQTGILSKFKNAEIRMVTNQPIVTKFRGQVRRGNSTLRYEVHIKESEMKEDGYYLTADAAIFNDEVQVISIESFGLKVVGERIEE